LRFLLLILLNVSAVLFSLCFSLCLGLEARNSSYLNRSRGIDDHRFGAGNPPVKFASRGGGGHCKTSSLGTLVYTLGLFIPESLFA
jgi:hypothetical protein